MHRDSQRRGIQELLSSYHKEAVIKDIDAFKLISPSGDAFRYQHITPFAKIVDRGLFDTILLNQARKEGTGFFQESYVEEVIQDLKGIKITYRSRRSHNSIRVTMVVIATGPSRPL